MQKRIWNPAARHTPPGTYVALQSDWPMTSDFPSFTRQVAHERVPCSVLVLRCVPVSIRGQIRPRRRATGGRSGSIWADQAGPPTAVGSGAHSEKTVCFRDGRSDWAEAEEFVSNISPELRMLMLMSVPERSACRFHVSSARLILQSRRLCGVRSEVLQSPQQPAAAKHSVRWVPTVHLAARWATLGFGDGVCTPVQRRRVWSQ